MRRYPITAADEPPRRGADGRRTSASCRGARRAAADGAVGLGALLALAACGRVVRVRTEFRAPAGTTLDAGRFHLSVAHNCRSLAPPPAHAPPPSTAPPDVVRLEVAPQGSGLSVELVQNDGHCWVRSTGWFDANGNGAVDPGDAVGSLPAAVLAEDHGLFRGNLTVTGPVDLAVVK